MMTMIVVGGLGLAALLGMLSYFSAERRFKRQLVATPRTPIAQAHQGLTKVAGQLVHAHPPLQAPLSGRPCAVYQVIVEERDGNVYRPIIHEIRGQPFLVYDETGRALIAYDEQTGLVIKKDVQLVSQTLQNPTPAMEALLQRYGHSSTRIFGLNKAIRYHEGVLEAGETVTVFGAASREPEGDPAAAAAGATWLVMRAAPGVELRVTDDAPPGR